ncbi:MAG: phosphonate ABC transporter [Cyanobacteriota bacterium]|nr:phosphonate ABC transporter [Cyanobacteriota bacterium]
MKPAAPLLPLLPAVVLLPLLLLLPQASHGGGWELIGQFAAAAVQPSLDPVVLGSQLQGLGITCAVALVSWSASVVLGLVLGFASARIVWQSLLGCRWPADLLARLLAIPRAIHELIWGLLLLQLIGLEPAVAVAAIAIPYGALVARVVRDLLDALPQRNLEALLNAGAAGPAALLSALGPPLLPGLVSYGGYRLECALRSATLLGVFGLGGLGNDLLLSLQSLQFHDLWSGLWLLLLVMLALETLIGLLRRHWAMPARLQLAGNNPAPAVGLAARQLLALLLALMLLAVLLCWPLQIHPWQLLRWQPLPPVEAGAWSSAIDLPWLTLVSGTLVLTLIAAALAVGSGPLLLWLLAPWGWGRALLQLVWALGRLWPPPLTALLLLFVLKPGLLPAALALGFHNLGILGRLLLEACDGADATAEQALQAAGVAPRLAWLYGRLSRVAQPYLAYGAYRSDVILRETVVVGLVGGTGLGSQLRESLSAFAWPQIALLLLAYALLTLVGEDLSDRSRRYLMGAT